jgi:plasmid stability protein
MEGIFASIMIRNLDDELKRRLRVRATENGRSMEAEVREILRKAVTTRSSPHNLGKIIYDRFAALGGADVTPSLRGPMRRYTSCE